jgi:hypothetical protein
LMHWINSMPGVMPLIFQLEGSNVLMIRDISSNNQWKNRRNIFQLIAWLEPKGYWWLPLMMQLMIKWMILHRNWNPTNCYSILLLFLIRKLISDLPKSRGRLPQF